MQSASKNKTEAINFPDVKTVFAFFGRVSQGVSIV